MPIQLSGGSANEFVRRVVSPEAVRELLAEVHVPGGIAPNPEGLPMSELEALAAPLPVVRTPVSGPSEVVIDEGNRLLLPLRAAEPFTDAVLRLLEHEPPRPVLAAPPLSECRWNHAIERYAPLTAEWQLAERHRTLAEEPGQLSTVGG